MRFSPLLVVVFALAPIACGGGGDGSLLLSGGVTGSFEGSAFTVQSGVLGKTNGQTNVIALGTDGIDCDAITAPDPPKGNFASIAVRELAVGTLSSTFVTLYINNGNFHGTGSSVGTLDITALDASSIEASIAYTDTIDGKTYALNGTFAVERCK